MTRDVTETQTALYDLHREWRELTSLRQNMREAPYDEAAERNLVVRLERHREKLHALRSAIIADLEEDLLGSGAAAGAPFLTHN
jgi:hypothetical protein